MRKRIILLVMLSMLVMGVVQASSINGDYNGNSIVKIKSDGKVLPVEDTPAIIYDGRTMVPIYMLKQLGVDVIWDANNYSVDVKLPKPAQLTPKPSVAPTPTPAPVPTVQPTNDQIGDFKNFVNSAQSQLQKKDVYLKAMSVNVDSSGIFVYAQYEYNNQITLEKFRQDIAYISGGNTLLSKYNIDGTMIELTSDQDTVGTVGIKNSDAVDFVNGKTTLDQYVLKWIITTNQNIAQPSPPTATSTPSASDVIESKIDGDFEGWDGETIFKLTNGQIWQQDSYAYKYSYKFMPEVLIYKSGSRYKMKVEDVDGEIYVKQLK